MRILDISYSPVASDPRVLRQIDWLQEAGRFVDVAGLGEKPDSLKGAYFQLVVPKLPTRLFLYTLTSKRYRYRKLITDQIPLVLQHRLKSGYYDMIHLNDLDFVPLVSSIQLKSPLRNNKTRLAIDLHEYFPGVKGGLFWRVCLREYNSWLFKKLLETEFDCYSTVSQEIAIKFADLFDLPAMVIIWNAPREQDLTFEEHINQQIELVYHGNAGKGRPLISYFLAVRKTNAPLRLHLMINASKFYKSFLKIVSRALCMHKKIIWHETVSVSEIVPSIKNFDAQLVWFPPTSENMLLSLGNKFFESVQGHLAIISGPSPSMASLIKKYDIGVISKGWTLRDLVSTLDSLDRATIERYRENSSIFSEKLSEVISRKNFLNEIVLESKYDG